MSSKPRFVGEKVKLGELLLNTFSGEWGTEEGELLTPVLRTSNFNEDGSLNYSTPAMRCIPKGKVAKKRMVRGDIILEKSGGTPKRPVGIMAFYDSDALALCSNFNQVLRFDESRILPRFAFHQLRWLKERSAFDRYTRKTTGLQNLQMKKLIELKLRVPQIEAQTSIATTLDEIVCDQRTLQQEIACLDSLVKSRFVEMFESKDYGMRPMGDLVESITAGTNVGGQQRPLGEGEYGVLKISAVTQGVFNPGELKAVNDVSHIKMIHPRKGDLLFSRANTSEMVGATAIVDKDYGDLFLPDKLWRLDPTDEVETVFLKALLSSPSIRAEMSKVSTGSSGSMQNISMAKFRKLPAFLPPLALQQEFAAFASQVDKSRFIAQQQIEKLQMLYDSLAQDYFGD